MRASFQVSTVDTMGEDSTHLTSETDDQTDWALVGLDGEMSSSELNEGGRLIQAGAAAWVDQPGGAVTTFTRLIHHDEMAWSSRAAAVHGISRDELAAAPSATEVDEELRVWLLANGGVDGRRLIVPIGLNVAAFDMPFFRQALPHASLLIARRAVDLNALCFTYAGWEPNSKSDNARDFAGWKRSMKIAANNELARRGIEVREHDAGFDAAQALLGWWWLRQQAVLLTKQVTQLDTRLDAADPLRALLGDGLLDRLIGIERSILSEIVALLPADVSPRRWFGTKRSALGCTPLAALLNGRLKDVISDLNISDTSSVSKETL